MNIRHNLSSIRKFVVLAVVAAALAVMALPVFAYDNALMVGPDAQLFIEDGSVSVWVPDTDGVWNQSIYISADEIAALTLDTEAAQLIAEAGDVSVYQLPTGEFQINNGPDYEGKVDVVILDSGLAFSNVAQWNTYTGESID
jgi:hypothetical protein